MNPFKKYLYYSNHQVLYQCNDLHAAFLSLSENEQKSVIERLPSHMMEDCIPSDLIIDLSPELIAKFATSAYQLSFSRCSWLFNNAQKKNILMLNGDYLNQFLPVANIDRTLAFEIYCYWGDILAFKIQNWDFLDRFVDTIIQEKIDINLDICFRYFPDDHPGLYRLVDYYVNKSSKEIYSRNEKLFHISVHYKKYIRGIPFFETLINEQKTNIIKDDYPYNINYYIQRWLIHDLPINKWLPLLITSSDVQCGVEMLETLEEIFSQYGTTEKMEWLHNQSFYEKDGFYVIKTALQHLINLPSDIFDIGENLKNEDGIENIAEAITSLVSLPHEDVPLLQ